jgi:hypothetical protein
VIAIKPTSEVFMRMIALLLCAVSIQAAAAELRSREGDPLKLSLGYVVLNEKSTLTRMHYVIDVPGIPVKLTEVAGIKTAYADRRYSWESTKDDLTASEPVTAVEVRFLLIDVFGNRLATLSAIEVADIAAGGSIYPNWRWNVRFDSEADAKSMHTTFGWVAQVRKSDGTVVKAKEAQILEAIKRYLPTVTAADLLPKEPGDK